MAALMVEQTFDQIKKQVTSLPMYGPWIAFKMADMIERCCGIPIDFSDCALSFYKDPVMGAVYLFNGDYETSGMDKHDRRAVVDAAVQVILGGLGDRMAPPFWDRPLNIQEAETILCKWKSHTRGHYTIGEDSEFVKQSIIEVKSVLGGEIGRMLFLC